MPKLMSSALFTAFVMELSPQATDGAQMICWGKMSLRLLLLGKDDNMNLHFRKSLNRTDLRGGGEIVHFQAREPSNMIKYEYVWQSKNWWGQTECS